MTVICNFVLISDTFNVCGISAEEEIFCSINEINCCREIPRLLDRTCNVTDQEIQRIHLRSTLISTHSLYRALLKNIIHTLLHHKGIVAYPKHTVITRDSGVITDD